MKTALISAAVTCLALASPLAAQTFACDTQSFATFSDDAKFAASNRTKQFTVDVTRRAVTVVNLSATAGSGETRYKIIARDGTQSYGQQTDEFAQRTLALPQNPTEVLQRLGYFPVTLVRQSDMSVNSWLLHCRAL